jgi:molybdopterin molybdotransferase
VSGLANPVMLGIALDSSASLKERIATGLQYDYLLIAGGVSMGEFDMVEDVLQELGVEIHFDKVNIKPGKPAVLGKRDNTVIFGLPGNPVSASTVFEIIVKPSVLRRMGYQNIRPVRVAAEIVSELQNRSGRETYTPAITHFCYGSLCVQPVKSKGSADVVAFARSNSFIVTAGNSAHHKGDRVEIILRSAFWQNPPTDLPS